MSIRGRRVVGFLGEYSAPSLTMPLAGSAFMSRGPRWTGFLTGGRSQTGSCASPILPRRG